MRRLRTKKTPTSSRFFVYTAGLFLLIGIVLPGRALGQVSLTEARVIELARSRSGGAILADAAEKAADATETATGQLPNPSVAWQRETLPGPGPTQDVLQLTVPVEIARPLAERSLAVSSSEGMRAEAEAERSAAIGRALETFYEAAIAQRRVEILEQEVASLDDAARVLARRTQAGETSGYESARLRVETEVVRSRLHLARGQLSAAKANLAAQLGLRGTEFAISAALDVGQVVREVQAPQAVRARPILVHSRRSVTEAQRARDRAAWAWLPTLSVSGGANIVRANDTQVGYVAGVSIGVPLFSHGQEARARALSQHALTSARTASTEQAIRAELAEAYAQYNAAREELTRFRDASVEPVEVLMRAARSGYREGARTIVELLDAQQAHTEVALQHLVILWEAKRAEVRIRVATGHL